MDITEPLGDDMANKEQNVFVPDIIKGFNNETNQNRVSPLLRFFINRGPVVQRLISTNPELNFNPGFYLSLIKSRFGIIFPILYSG